jgi:hypothetical protein
MELAAAAAADTRRTYRLGLNAALTFMLGILLPLPGVPAHQGGHGAG